MSTDLTPDDIAASLAGKADHLTVPTVPEPMAITIRRINRGPDKQRPVRIHFGGDLSYLPCLTVRRLLVLTWGTQDPREWLGRELVLYVDPTVTYGKDKTGGIRVSHASHIDRPQTHSLIVSQHQRKDYTVRPISEWYAERKRAGVQSERPAAPDPTKIIAAFDKIGVSVEDLEAHAGKPRAEWDADTVADLRVLYSERSA